MHPLIPTNTPLLLLLLLLPGVAWERRGVAKEFKTRQRQRGAGLERDDVRRHDENPRGTTGTGIESGGGQHGARDEGGGGVAIFGTEKWVVGELLQRSLGRDGIRPTAQDGAVLRGSPGRGPVRRCLLLLAACCCLLLVACHRPLS